MQSQREQEGVPVDDETWRQIVEVARKYGVTAPS
jgi:LDH2 family malate/lactate/ureidoglycolate dehydrogenase